MEGTGRPRASVELARGSREGDAAVLRFRGPLTLETTPDVWDEVGRAADEVGQGRLDVDLAHVDRADSSGAALLMSLRTRLGADRVRFRDATGQVAAVLRILERAGEEGAAQSAPDTGPETVVHAIGQFVHELAADVRETIAYLGGIALGLAGAARRPRRVRWRETFLYMVRVGPDALGIVGLITFLMGLILGFQGVAQLGKLGFQSYTPDLVGLSVVAELGPLMTGIILAGRSGSAFAAEIGTMKVREEIDALDTMGLDRVRFLVLPKVVALLAMMPLLVVFGNACGVGGGLAVGAFSLDMTVEGYLRRTLERVDLWDFTQGMIKGEAYAVVIAAVGCLRGLRTRPGAQGVGLSATAAVVASVFWIVCVDAVLTVVFHHLGPYVD